MRSTWPSAVAGLVLIGGGLLMNYGIEIPSAGVQAVSANQLTVMINKMNQIIAPVEESSAEPFHPAVGTDNSSASRFVVAFPGVVLDKQTGLVWEEVPDATPKTWTDAARYCVGKTVGGNRLAVAFDGGAQERAGSVDGCAVCPSGHFYRCPVDHLLVGIDICEGSYRCVVRACCR